MTGDVITPMKQALFGDTGLPTDLDEIEDGINRAIYKRFGIDPPSTRILDVVHLADRIALANEWRDLMPKSHPCPTTADPSPYIKRIFAYPWQLARRRFLEAFRRLAPAAGIVLSDAQASA